MYLIIKQKWIRSGSQNGEYVIDCCSRKREANGLVRHHFKSNLDVLIKHHYDWEDYDIDEDDHWVALADKEGIYYYVRFMWREDS